MAKLLNVALDVDSKSINPTLLVTCEFEYFSNWETPVSVSGELLLSDNRRATQMIWNHLQRSLNTKLTFPNNEVQRAIRDQPDDNKNSIKVILSAELSPRVIDQIELLRAKDPEKAARFSANISFTSIRSETTQRNNENEPRLGLEVGNSTFSLVSSQGEWVRKFSEPLGIGKFLLVELRLMDHMDLPKEWKEVFQHAQARLVEMEEYLRHGAWLDVISRGRMAFEAIKVFDDKIENAALKTEFDAALLASNHDTDGISDLDKGVKGIYHYASKFVHARSKTGILKPNPIATKEDAYLMYSLCLNILNMVGSKLHLLALMTPKP